MVMRKNLFNTQPSGVYQQMVKVFLMGLHGDGLQPTQIFFFCSIVHYRLLKLSRPCSIL